MEEVDLDSDFDDRPAEASADQDLAAVSRELHQVEVQIEALLVRQAALQEERERLQRLRAVQERAPLADWAAGTFAWDQRVQQLLGDVFGLSSFRRHQREVINATLQGRDVLCLMPSGGGKSLCYQLPALLGGSGLTLVVSPLLSLIQDQVLGLSQLGVHAAAITSLTSKEDAATISKQVEDGGSRLRLLYCTPEKVVTSKRFFAKLEKVYKAGRLDRVAIDEAHCCSQWGNDFRPDYKKLGILKQQFPDTPIIALTATATQEVCDDLRAILKIQGCEFFKSSINRPNLFYEVRAKPAGAKDLVADIAAWVTSNYPGGESGIVYVLTRKDAESLAQELRDAGVSCQAYHADMEGGWRQGVHQQWSQGQVQVIVATIAFGMGINNPHVRFVIHHTISKSIENYYQESGRAGRDGLPAHCRLYWRLGDYLRQATVVTMESNWEPCLRGMLQYASSPTCKRALLCRHFGEAPARCAAMCSCCARQLATAPAIAAALQAAEGAAGGGGGEGGGAAAPGRAAAGAGAVGAAAAQDRDVTAAAQGALLTLQGWPGAEKRATLIQLLDKWRGSKDAAVSAAAKALSRDECEAVLQALLLQGYLQLDFGWTAYATNAYLKATARAPSLLQGKHRIFIPAPLPGNASNVAVKPEPGAAAAIARERTQQLAQRSASASAPTAAGTAAADGSVGCGAAGTAAAAGTEAQRRAAEAAAAGALEEARSRLAAAFDTIPAAVLSDDQVRQLAVQRPASRQGLGQLIGAEKAELYGAELLAALLAGGSAAAAPLQQPQQQQQGRQRQKASELKQPQQAAPLKQQQQQPPKPGRKQPRQQAPKAESEPPLAVPQQQQQQQRWKRPAQGEVVVLDSSSDDDDSDGDVAAPPAPRPGPKRGKGD